MATTNIHEQGCNCEMAHMESSPLRDSDKHGSYDHVLKYTGVFGGVQILKLLASVVRNKLTAIFLGGKGVGLISVYNSISEFVVCSSNLGVPLNATRQSSELLEEGDAERIQHFIIVVRTWVLLTALLSVVLCSLLSPLVSYILFDQEFSHWPQVMTMIPVVVSFLVAEGECAVLKGLRKVRQVAIIETVIAIATLCLTVPFYYLMGMRGVVVGLICSSFAALVVHLWFTLRIAPYRVRLFDRQVLREGLPMVTKGIPYVLAGVSTAALGMAIPALIQLSGTLADVGYYRMGYGLMVGYAGMVFMALEADYYPRLSSVNHSLERFNRTINQQIDVCVLIVTPFLIPLIVLMPWIIRILFNGEFLVAENMAVCAAFYTFLRAIMLPVSYSSLAKGDSMVFLIMEVASNIVMGLLFWWLYSSWGLIGAGIALSLNALYDVVCVLLVYGKLYGCRVERATWRLCIVQALSLSVAVACCLQDNIWIRYGIGLVLFIFSLRYSLRLLSRRSGFFQRVASRFRHD
ncbi:MAG: oligosaccharide flippase family protein [Bacteroidaceae bacterium]